jgi:hypothetical protein
MPLRWSRDSSPIQFPVPRLARTTHQCRISKLLPSGTPEVAREKGQQGDMGQPGYVKSID